jgi:hypothetical protein
MLHLLELLTVLVVLYSLESVVFLDHEHVLPEYIASVPINFGSGQILVFRECLELRVRQLVNVLYVIHVVGVEVVDCVEVGIN